jgi:hypothetical protein
MPPERSRHRAPNRLAGTDGAERMQTPRPLHPGPPGAASVAGQPGGVDVRDLPPGCGSRGAHRPDFSPLVLEVFFALS